VPARHPRTERLGLVRKAAPKPDWGKIAQAARGRVLAPPVRKAPTRVAVDKGPCPRCGIRILQPAIGNCRLARLRCERAAARDDPLAAIGEALDNPAPAPILVEQGDRVAGDGEDDDFRPSRSIARFRRWACRAGWMARSAAITSTCWGNRRP
jgi:hypothetical protein